MVKRIVRLVARLVVRVDGDGTLEEAAHAARDAVVIDTDDPSVEIEIDRVEIAGATRSEE